MRNTVLPLCAVEADVRRVVNARASKADHRRGGCRIRVLPWGNPRLAGSREHLAREFGR
ncbi:MAG: hypothetical protein ACTHMO_06300 [Rhodanobacteraceae bacterium]